MASRAAETFSLVALGAPACARPVVALRRGALPMKGAWLTSSNAKAEGENVLPIVGSINIFLNAYGSSGGGPNPVTIDGVDYDMFRYGTTLSYWRRGNQSTPITAIHLDVAKFLADGQSRGAFQSTWWLAEVETSTWVTEGTGGIGLTDYKVAFQAAAP